MQVVGGMLLLVDVLHSLSVGNRLPLLLHGAGLVATTTFVSSTLFFQLTIVANCLLPSIRHLVRHVRDEPAQLLALSWR